MTAGRQDQLRWLCYFSLSCDQCFASAAPPPPTHPPPPPPLPGLQSSADRHRETSVAAETKISRLCRHIFRLTGSIRREEKEPGRGWGGGGGGGGRQGPQYKPPFVWAKTRRRLCSGILMSASWFILSLTSGWSSLSDTADAAPGATPPQAFIQSPKHIRLRLCLTERFTT